MLKIISIIRKTLFSFCLNTINNFHYQHIECSIFKKILFLNIKFIFICYINYLENLNN